MAAKASHPLVEQIRKEHQLIRQLIEATLKDPSPRGLDLLWDLVELKHNGQEEEGLFLEALRNPGVRSGGPFCTLFFDLYRMNSPEATLLMWGLKMQRGPTQEKFFKESHPVQIPLSEHMATRALLLHLRQNYETLSVEDRQSVLRDYQSLQLLHMQKEEDCFLVMMESLLTPAELDRLWSSWSPIEVSHLSSL